MNTLASNLSGKTLLGHRGSRKWLVGNKIEVPLDRSQPSFSVGYEAVSDDGIKAFIKATDIGLLTNDGGSLYERLRVALDSHGFERSILEHCRKSTMDRIVVAIDYGDDMMMHGDSKQPLFFLVFELAKYDLRRHYDKTTGFSLAWTMGALHQLCIGVEQLHSGDVTHNDLKPANFLVFADDAQKISDLGCATSPLFSALHELRHNPGDIKYAAPELLYANEEATRKALCSFSSRRAADLYNLGSMAFYLLTGAMLTPQVISRLAPQHRPASHDGGWNGNWLDAMPYWREAFSRVLQDASTQALELERPAYSDIIYEITTIIGQLCEPDSSLRGHPLNRTGSNDMYGLQRYISAFNKMRLRAVVIANG